MHVVRAERRGRNVRVEQRFLERRRGRVAGRLQEKLYAGRAFAR